MQVCFTRVMIVIDRDSVLRLIRQPGPWTRFA